MHNSNSTNHIASKDVCLALVPEAKSNWNKISRGLKAKMLKGKKDLANYSTFPNKP